MSEVQQSAIPAPAVEDIAITDDTNQSEKTSETTVSASEAEVLITHGEDDDEESSQAPDELSSDTTGKAIESPESPQAVEPEEQLNSDNKTGMSCTRINLSLTAFLNTCIEKLNWTT